MRRLLSSLNLVFSTILLFFLVLVLYPVDRYGKKINKLGKLWAQLQLRIAGITVIIEGAEHIIQPPYIIMCNHQSELDIFALLATLNMPAKWLAKKELFSIPFLGWLLRMGKNIAIDRKNPYKALQAIREATSRIQEGMTVIVFPEGTWSTDGNLLPFKKGAFTIALRTRIPILPVGIKGTGILQPEGSFVPVQKGLVHIKIGEPIEIKGKIVSDSDALVQEVRSRIEYLITADGSI